MAATPPVIESYVRNVHASSFAANYICDCSTPEIPPVGLAKTLAEQASAVPYVEEKTLVTCETILDVTKHPNADSLYIARVQGYDVIINPSAMFPNTNPNELVGKTIVYFQIDSVLPDKFANEGFWNYMQGTYMGKKIISAKLRGIVSQGLIMTFDALAKLFPDIPLSTLPLGHNLTNDLGVIKFYSKYDAEGPMYDGSFDRSQYKSRPSPASLRPFPDFLNKTDQERLQNNIKLIRNLPPDRLFTAQIKYDGQSVQWFCNFDRIGVCSRNFQVLLEYDLPAESRDQSNNKFREMNAKYSLLDKLTVYCTENKCALSIQTEMYGTSINSNRHKKNDVDIVVFDVYDITARCYLPAAEVEKIADTLGLPKVTVVFKDQPLLSTDVTEWITLANAQCNDGPKGEKLQAEGIVVKSSDNRKPYVSFKVISPEYLIKHKL